MESDRKILGNTQQLFLAWKIFGGWRSVIKSSDFWLAVFVWGLCANYWLTECWWDQVISVLPNILGFTLAGFAITLGIGNDDFREMLSRKDESKSIYLSVSASFIIFVWFQLAALLYAFCAKAMHFDLPKQILCLAYYVKVAGNIFSGLGYFLFLYSLTLAMRAALRVFRLSRWFNDFMVEKKES